MFRLSSLFLALALPVHAGPLCDMIRGGDAVTGCTKDVCQWGYDFRDPAAKERFHTVDQDIAMCFPDRSPTGDLGVNHPDTYTLRIYDTDRGIIRVSLKDKAALAQTFVFLQIVSKNQ